MLFSISSFYLSPEVNTSGDYYLKNSVVAAIACGEGQGRVNITSETLELMLKSTKLCGKYDFPIMNSCVERPQELIPFNFALSSKQKEGWLHFFIDDYQFERLWNNPLKYLPIIKRFDGVIAPDFSMFTDMPLAQQIYNCWRNRVISVWLQNEGIKVVPTVEWSDRNSLEWCLDGLPLHGTIAVQTNGCFTDSKSRMNFIKGMDYICNKLSPSSVLIYGRGEEFRNYFPDTYFVESYCQNLKKRL